MKQIFLKKYTFSILFVFFALSIQAQGEKIELLKYGNLDHWIVRQVKESFVIGGHTRHLYEIAEGDTLFDNTAYKNTKSPWATSSVMAKVKGVVKASITVFPEKRNSGYCARLETRIENVKVLGLIDINVLASGTIFLGQMVEPIRDTKNPQSKLITGLPFTKRPKALIYDYKVITGGNCIKSTGFSGQKKLSEKDQAETQLLLQHRWEDAEGNVYAKRVATAWERFDKTTNDWHNNHRLNIHYGDISSQSIYQSYMRLRDGDQSYYTRNSKGKMVPIHEIGWASADEAVTHIVLQFSSSNGGAYIGSPDSRFWIDNVKLAY